MNESAGFLNGPLARALAAALVHFVWQGALVALLLAAVERLVQRERPQRRYAAACGALLLLVVLPAATLLRATREAAAPPRRPAAAERVAPAPSSVARATAGPVAALWTRLPSLSARAAAGRPWLLAAWGVGVLLLSIRLSIQWISAQRLRRRRTRPAPRKRRGRSGRSRRVFESRARFDCSSPRR